MAAVRTKQPLGVATTKSAYRAYRQLKYHGLDGSDAAHWIYKKRKNGLLNYLSLPRGHVSKMTHGARLEV